MMTLIFDKICYYRLESPFDQTLSRLIALYCVARSLSPLFVEWAGNDCVGIRRIVFGQTWFMLNLLKTKWISVPFLRSQPIIVDSAISNRGISSNLVQGIGWRLATNYRVKLVVISTGLFYDKLEISPQPSIQLKYPHACLLTIML